jgi:predicted phosphodiesterase
MARVLVIPDTHCPGMRRGYVDFLKRVADRWGIDRAVHIGDLVDLAALSFHEKHPALRNTLSELRAARRQIATLAAAFPKADWLIGNHDALTERQAQTVGIPDRMLRDYADLWEIPWTVHPRFSKLTIDGVLYAHGDGGRAGADAALAQAKDNFRSTVIGHFHSQAGVKWWANREFRVFGLSVGCGIDIGKLQFAYGRRIVAKPILGCGVVLDGQRALFEPWLLKSR